VFSAFVLPLGPSDREVRRQQWVTYGIILLCLLVFHVQLLLRPGPEWRGELETAWSAAVEYAVEHPYLALPLALKQFSREDISRRTAAKRVPTPSAERVAAEQQELDRRTEELLRALDQKPERRWGMVPARASWGTSVTSMFVHDGWMHLLGNMLFLVFAGAFVEDVYGRVLFLVLYLGAGLFGDWATVLADPGSYVVSYGASGAIAGVEGAFLVRFATRRLEFLSLPVLWLPVARVRVSIPAYLYLVPWLIGNVISLARNVPGVGWRAHIAGFLFGVLFAAVMRLGLVEKRLVHPRIEAKISLRQHPAVASAFAQRMAGRPEVAQRIVAGALAEAPGDLGLLREAYDSAVAAGDPVSAAHHAARVLETLRSRTDRDSVREGLRFIRDVEAALDGSVQPRFWRAAAEYVETRGDRTRAMLYYERITGGPDPALARLAAFRKERLRRQVVGSAVSA